MQSSDKAAWRDLWEEACCNYCNTWSCKDQRSSEVHCTWSQWDSHPSTDKGQGGHCQGFAWGIATWGRSTEKTHEEEHDHWTS